MKPSLGSLDDEEFLIWGFMITNSERLDQLKARWRRKASKTHLWWDKSQLDNIPINDLWWEIFYINPNNLSEGQIWWLDIFYPSWLYYNYVSKKLYVCSNHDIKVVKHWKIIESLNNNLFNCLHWIAPQLNSNNLLVTSTWIDCLVSIDPLDPWKIQYIWNATKNWYNLSPSYWERTIDMWINHQGINYPTLWHTTHINSAINYKEWKILATLFHQWELIEIDIDSHD